MEHLNFLNKKVFLHENDQISKWLQDDYFLVGEEGRYETHLVDVFKKYVRKDFYVVDGGAHLGMHTLRLSDLAHEGHVYAFEASPRTFEKLKQTIEYNNIKNVTVYNNALFKENTDVHILEHYNADQDTVVMGRSDVHKNIQAICLDSLNLERVDFIKLDIEGGEYFAILGAKETIQKHRPLITYEFLPRTPSNLNPKLPLEEWGYQIYQLHTAEGQPHFDYLGVHKDSIEA